jgi:hypothetical protein
MEDAAIFGIGATAFLIAAGIGCFVNSLVLWIVTRFLMRVPDATLWLSIKTVLAMIVVTIIMLVLLFFMAMLPLIGPVIWAILYLRALKATIEGVMELQSGGWTILILFVGVQWALNYGIQQLQ